MEPSFHITQTGSIVTTDGHYFPNFNPYWRSNQDNKTPLIPKHYPEQQTIQPELDQKKWCTCCII